MPSLPNNPDTALQDAALDAFVQSAFQRYPELERRSAIGWAIVQYYGMDTRYDFDTYADSLNVSNWTSLWHDGNADLQKRLRIWQLYLARYAGDAVPANPYNETPTQSTARAFIEGLGEGLSERAKDTFSPVVSSFQFIGNNLVPLAVGLIAFAALLMILNTRTVAKVLNK